MVLDSGYILQIPFSSSNIIIFYRKHYMIMIFDEIIKVELK